MRRRADGSGTTPDTLEEQKCCHADGAVGLMFSRHKRYSHITAIRCYGVNRGQLGMNNVISEDSLCSALKRIPETEGIAWLDQHIADSTAPLLDVP